jgi:hypothetical protein
MFHLPILGSVVEVAEFEDEFFLGGILERGSEVDQNLTFLTVALMVDRRPRMWRSRQNATILIFTCLIRRLDGSRMSSLLSAIGYLGFSYKTCTMSSPTVFLRRHFSCLLCAALLPLHRREQKTLVAALLWLHLCSWLSRGKRRGREEGQPRKIRVAPGESKVAAVLFCIRQPIC